MAWQCLTRKFIMQFTNVDVTGTIKILIMLQFAPPHKLLICTIIITHRFCCGDNTLHKCADGTLPPPFCLQLFTYMYVCVARPLYARTRETRGAAFTLPHKYSHIHFTMVKSEFAAFITN